MAQNHQNLTPLLFAAFCIGSPISPMDVLMVDGEYINWHKFSTILKFHLKAKKKKILPISRWRTTYFETCNATIYIL